MNITQKVISKLKTLNGQAVTASQLRGMIGGRVTKIQVQKALSYIYTTPSARPAGLTRFVTASAAAKSKSSRGGRPPYTYMLATRALSTNTASRKARTK